MQSRTAELDSLQSYRTPPAGGRGSRLGVARFVAENFSIQSSLNFSNDENLSHQSSIEKVQSLERLSQRNLAALALAEESPDRIVLGKIDPSTLLADALSEVRDFSRAEP